jgi:glycosyltransferase involved in cell wall biosynthesis
MKPEVSLIIATFNRSGPLNRLLGSLVRQTLPKNNWEVIVAVDGSVDETELVLKEWARKNDLQLDWFRQENAGQATARHNGILRSRSEKTVIADDDLYLSEGFLESHLNTLEGNDEKTIVIGKVIPTGEWKNRPLYEMVREYSNTIMHQSFERGSARPTAEALITQNVSFYKKFYMEIGGFDLEMRLGEDTELGTRFERAGGHFVYCKDAWAIHESNIGSYEKWIKRQYDYGRFSWLAWKKSGKNFRLHPLKDFCTGNKLNRLMVLVLGRSDGLTDWMVTFLNWFGSLLKRIGLLFPAVATHKAIISLKQHQGLKDTFGSWSNFRKAEKEYRTYLLQKKGEGGSEPPTN